MTTCFFSKIPLAIKVNNAFFHILMRLQTAFFHCIFVSSEKQLKQLLLQQKNTAMKQIFILTAALIITTGLFAFTGESKKSVVNTMKVLYQSPFNKIVVEDDIDIRLSESTDRLIEFAGDKKYTQQVEWKIREGVLYVKSKAGSLKDKVQVSVSVNQLRDLLIKGASDVRSEGALNSETLKVTVDGEGYVAIQNTGTIIINKPDDIHLKIKRVSGKVNLD